MHTVPRRPAGGCQRAKRIETPSRVLRKSVTKLSGTGLAGIEIRLIGGFRRLHVAYNSPRPRLNQTIAAQTAAATVRRFDPNEFAHVANDLPGLRAGKPAPI